MTDKELLNKLANITIELAQAQGQLESTREAVNQSTKACREIHTEIRDRAAEIHTEIRGRGISVESMSREQVAEDIRIIRGEQPQGTQGTSHAGSEEGRQCVPRECP